MPFHVPAKDLRVWKKRLGLTQSRQVPDRKEVGRSTASRRRAETEAARWRCWDCKETFTTEKGYEFHRSMTGHHRYDWAVE